MIIENELLKEYNTFIKSNSIFGDSMLLLPDTPQSFSSFPTIIFRENGNVDSTAVKSTNSMEYGDDLTYQVDIYTKDLILDGTRYSSKIVINEIRELTHKFFRNCGFERNSDVPSEYIDLSVKRRSMTFSAVVNSWNKSIN